LERGCPKDRGEENDWTIAGNLRRCSWAALSVAEI